MVLLTGRRVSTLPFLQRDIINSNVSFNAWSPNPLKYDLQRVAQVIILNLERPKKPTKIKNRKKKGNLNCSKIKTESMHSVI